MSDHGHFSPYEGHKERRTGKIRGAFSRMHTALDGRMLARAKLGLVDQNWLERNFSVFLLRTLVVGRRQHSESIEVALDME